VWTPVGAGRGTLALTIGEAGVPPGLTASAFSAPAGLTGAAAPVSASAAADDPPAPLTLQLSLSPGASADPEGTLDSRCTPPAALPGPLGGQLITCSLDQPPTGETDTFSFGLVVNQPGQEAMLRLFRGDTVEAELPAPLTLDRIEDEVTVSTPTWTPYVGVRDLTLPAGQVGVGVTNTGPRTATGAAVRLTLVRDAGFVPPTLFSDLLQPGGLLDSSGLGGLVPPGLRDQLLKRLLEPLPPGCAVEGWTPPAQVGDWLRVLRGGLPTTIVCQLGDIAPGASASIQGLLAVTQPLYFDGNGRIEDGAVTAQVELGGVAVGTPATLDLPPPGGGAAPVG
jgi:hypothetical protein